MTRQQQVAMCAARRQNAELICRNGIYLCERAGWRHP